MKYPETLALSILVAVSFSESSIAQSYANVGFSCEQCTGYELQIESFSLIHPDSEVLFSEKINSSGIVTTNIPVKSGRLISISLNETETKRALRETFYIEPGGVLEVELADSTWSAKGLLGRVHKHRTRINQVDKERNAVFQASYNYSKAMGSTEIQTAYSQLRAHQEEIRAEIESDDLLSQRLKHYLLAENIAPERGFELFLDGQRIYREHHWGSKKSDKVSLSFADFPEHLIDSNMIFSFRYFLPFSTSLSLRLIGLMDRYPPQNSSGKPEIYEFLKRNIMENPKMATFPDFFLAFCLASGYVADNIAYDELENANRSFKADYPNSPFLGDLDKVLAEYTTLKPGAPARDFAMASPEGDTLKLSDFKGKLVYIDLWATWCGPCKAEFKYSKKLSTRYADRKDLIFMYVSMDSDAGAWRRFLSKNPGLKGIHGIQQPSKEFDPEAEKQTVYQLYKANGIPHYILIDKNGNIIEYKAPRPSELVRSDYLEKLLQKTD